MIWNVQKIEVKLKIENEKLLAIEKRKYIYLRINEW